MIDWSPFSSLSSFISASMYWTSVCNTWSGGGLGVGLAGTVAVTMDAGAWVGRPGAAGTAVDTGVVDGTGVGMDTGIWVGVEGVGVAGTTATPSVHARMYISSPLSCAIWSCNSSTSDLSMNSHTLPGSCGQVNAVRKSLKAILQLSPKLKPLVACIAMNTTKATSIARIASATSRHRVLETQDAVFFNSLLLNQPLRPRILSRDEADESVPGSSRDCRRALWARARTHFTQVQVAGCGGLSLSSKLNVLSPESSR